MTARRTSTVATCDQWARGTHAGTAVTGTPPALTLNWQDPVADTPTPPTGPRAARGLATDRLCRVYRLGRTVLDRLVVGPTRGGLDYARLPAPSRILGGEPPPGPATDHFRPAAEPDLLDGAGIAIDREDRLFVADRGRGQVAVLDLWSHRTLRIVRTASPHHPRRRPGGMAADADGVLVVVQEPAGLLRLSATRGPREVALPGAGQMPAGAEPVRVVVLPGVGPVVLWLTPDGSGLVAAGARPPEPVGPASDIAVDADGALVVAPGPGTGTAAARRLPLAAGWRTAAPPLDVAGNDGSGLVATADGRIGYWTAAGFRLAVRAAVRYVTTGVCVTYRLDAKVPGNRWGRLFLDACVPPGTGCTVATATSDDEYATALPHTPPVPAVCVPGGPSPALPPTELAVATAKVTAPLHARRDDPSPWWRPAPGDPVAVFEAPVLAPPGRYLWVTLRLTGDGRRTPAVRALRAEHEAHDLTRRLPAVLADADPTFLHRFLALFDGLLYELDLRAERRDLLVDPATAPVEALDWLASFVGLLLDDRWSEAARRQLLAEIVPLYRLRGTVGALSRYLEIFLGSRPVIVEHFRLRGVDAAAAAAAHRFSVLVARPLDATQTAAVRHVLDVERPAHTSYELCTVEAGMRVGEGLHLGLTSMVGPTGAFDAAVAGSARLGRGTLLGGLTTGVAVEAARVGATARVG